MRHLLECIVLKLGHLCRIGVSIPVVVCRHDVDRQNVVSQNAEQTKCRKSKCRTDKMSTDKIHATSLVPNEIYYNNE